MLENGGTGVAPVKSGVAPDFVGRFSIPVARPRQDQFTFANGFGRDAQNDRPEACATQAVFKPQPLHFLK
jgi:hypothetical protein